MYGCIIGKDTDGLWLLADGPYQNLESALSTYRQLNPVMDIRMFKVDTEEFKEIKKDLSMLEKKFSELFV